MRPISNALGPMDRLDVPTLRHKSFWPLWDRVILVTGYRLFPENK